MLEKSVYIHKRQGREKKRHWNAHHSSILLIDVVVVVVVVIVKSLLASCYTVAALLASTLPNPIKTSGVSFVQEAESVISALVVVYTNESHRYICRPIYI